MMHPPRYVRTVKDLDLSSETEKQRFLDIIGGILKDLHVRVAIDGDLDEDEDEEDSPVLAFIKSLRDRSNLHFAAAAKIGA